MSLAAARMWPFMDKAGRAEAIRIAHEGGYGIEDIAAAAGIKRDNRLLVSTLAALATAPAERELAPSSVPEPGDRVGHAVSAPDVPVDLPARSVDRDPPTIEPFPIPRALLEMGTEPPPPERRDDDPPDMVEVAPHRTVQRKIARRLGILGASA